MSSQRNESWTQRRYDITDMVWAFLFGVSVMGSIMALIIVLCYRYVGF